MRLHPIMYVPDQYAEREFYARFGFTPYYEGDEFPGFLAIQNGEAIIGLSGHPTIIRRTAMGCVGSSRPTRWGSSNPSSRRVRPMTWTMRLSSKLRGRDSSRGW
jgi:hypothetical protein